MILTDNEILSSLIINNKDRFIKKLQPIVGITDGQTQTLIDFFHKHANLENQIPWNDIDKDPNGVYDKIIQLAHDTTVKANERNARKTDIKSLFTSENFKVLNEDDNFIYVAPLDYDGAVYMDSYDSGGQGAKWCIGWATDNRYWKQYVGSGDAFVLIMTKPSAQTTLYEQFKKGDVAVLSNMDESDNKAMVQIHKNGKVSVWSQVKDRQIVEGITVEQLSSYGFNVPTDSYDTVRTAMNELRDSRGEEPLKDVESAKGQALIAMLEDMDGEATDVEMLYGNDSFWSGNGKEWKVLTNEEADEDWREYLQEFVNYPSEYIGERMYDYVDEDWFEDAYEEDCGYSWDDRLSDEEKVEWILDNTDVDESEEFFEVDEDGDVDRDQPKFDLDDYRQTYIDDEKDSYDGYDSASDWYKETFGDESYYEVVDKYDLFDGESWINDQMRWRDRGADVGRYDNVEHWIRTNDGEFYIYREQ